MAYSVVPTVATGDLWTAANHNTYIRDNFLAGVPGIFTTKGDLAAATGAGAAARLAAGAAGQILTPDAAEAAGLKWKSFPTWGEWTNASWNSVSKNIGVYTVSASDWTGVPASGVGAIIVGVHGKWAAAGDGSYFSAVKVGSLSPYVLVRAHTANSIYDAYGVIPLVNGQLDLRVQGANATEVILKIYGYFPG